MNLGLISKHRNSIFGISIIGIILFHFCESYMNAVADGLASSNLVVFLYYHIIGSTGVEIFLFLSGVGLYYSFSKNNSLKRFYKRRFERILICYIPIGMFFWILGDFVFSKSSIFIFLEDFTLLSFWINGRSTFWFIALLIILYLLFPVIYNILYKNGEVSFINFLGLIVLSIAITILLSIAVPEWYEGVEIALTRIPVFCFGCYTGRNIALDQQIQRRDVVIIVIVGLVARCVTKVMDLPTIFSRYAATLWAISLLLLLCLCLDKLTGTFIERGLKIVGNYSLELYLSHVMMRSLMNSAGFPTYLCGNYLIVILMSVIISIALHKISSIIIKYYS